MKKSSNLKSSNGGIRPPLKWAGGKRWLLPYLKPLWEAHKEKRFVEPFCGGLAVSLGLLPEKAWVNDINPHVINFYFQLKKGLKTKLKFKNDADSYYENRDRFNDLIRDGEINTPESAELFYYLNRTGFNGLCRFNNSGFYNIPFGRNKTINYLQDFSEYKTYFGKWKFTHKDFRKLKLKDDDFVYADPPYDVPFTQYSVGGFSWDDQVEVAKWLSKHKGPVILSNEATPRILKLYKSLGYKIRIIDAPRVISCTGNRKKVKEVLATRNL
ncbi:adenine methyltransferase [bacterium]|nr:adenine methyltransferase [bacterium]|tara:strand:+ start:18399 stop:19208 length:810 start_codon:yes stop_codon:yes gene_type:complete